MQITRQGLRENSNQAHGLLPQLLIQPYVHRQVALALVEASIAFDGLYLQLSATQKLSNRAKISAFSEFTWGALLSLKLSCFSHTQAFTINPFETDLEASDFQTDSSLFQLKEAKTNPYAAYGKFPIIIQNKKINKKMIFTIISL